MSLESIQTAIGISVNAEKIKIQKDLEISLQTYKKDLESEYLAAKNKAFKLIEKELQEQYTQKLLTFKLNEKKKILDTYKNIIDRILFCLKNSLIDLIGQDKYLQFLKKQIQTYATPNDTLYLSEKDIKMFGDEIKSNFNGTITADNTINCGIIIEQDHFNYNFSIHSLIEEYYDDIEKFLGQKFYV